MYERFTDRARKVMQLANQEAKRFRHEYIGTEHMLLGLVAEGSGVAANVLKNLDIDLRKLRLEVEKIVQHAPFAEEVVGRLPQTPKAKKVIEYAIEEARNLKHNYVGTEHLLLGLLRDQEGVAAQILMNLDLKLDEVREEVQNLLGHNILPDTPRAATVKLPVLLFPPGASPSPDPLTDDQVQMVRERIRLLEEHQEAFVASLDFALAARCRNEAAALTRLLAWYDWLRNQS